MRTELLAALEESLDATPDPAEVLAGIQAGIERRHRRNRYARTGFAISAIAVILILSLVAASAIPKPTYREPAKIPVGEWRTTIQPTWLPSGMTLDQTINTAVHEWLAYNADKANLIIIVDNIDRQRNVDQPGWQRIEINGLPAREHSRPAGTNVTAQLPSGRWFDVFLNLSPDSRISNGQPALRDDAIRVAAGLRERPGDILRVGFAPTYLPLGQRIIGGMSPPTKQPTPGHGSIITAGGSLQPGELRAVPAVDGLVDNRHPPDLGPGLSISVDHSQVIVPFAPRMRIADIQGREAYFDSELQVVIVRGFHSATLTVGATYDGHNPVQLDPSRRLLLIPKAELIRVAEGVRWVE